MQLSSIFSVRFLMLAFVFINALVLLQKYLNSVQKSTVHTDEIETQKSHTAN